MPKVSVIIPVYNSQKYLKETLDSALNQTFRDYEILIVDDGSTDGTKNLIDGYVKRFPDILRYIYQNNAGPSVARNRGIKMAQGEYIAFLDSDDLWMPERLEEGIQILDQQKDVGLVHARTRRIDAIGNPAKTPERKSEFLSGNIFEHLLLRREHISCVTVLVRKECVEAVGFFDEKMSLLGSEDRDLWMRIAQRYKFQFIDKVLAQYRVGSVGLSKNIKNMVEGRLYSVNKLFLDHKNHQLRSLALAQIHREYGDFLRKQRKFKDSQKEYWKSLRLYPYVLLTWLKLAAVSANTLGQQERE